MFQKKWMKVILASLVVLFVFLLIWFGMIQPNLFFGKQEKKLEQAGIRYFEVNNTHIPKQENKVASVNLETLIKQKYVDNLLIPYSEKMCDVKDSSVKVVRKNGKINYYTYLKCGKYQSDTDHTGPKITLNGQAKMEINRGGIYQEAGVKSVADNVDGKMDISKVTIKGSVDTSKVGTYKVSYTAFDSLSNKTEVIRTVEVIESLAETVKEQTGGTGRYTGLVTNNYIMFNHMLFRIVKVNDDNTITIVSDDALSNIDYGSKTGKFVGSSIDKWLNEYFYNLLDKKYQELIVPSKWCDDIITEVETNKTECTNESKKRNIGLLSVQDYNLSLLEYRTYLELTNLVWYTNHLDNNNFYAITSSNILPMKSSYLLNIRPALTLKADTKILEGDGSEASPFIILNDTTGKKTSKINERKLGEFINYSGYLWRIVDKKEDNTTEVIMHSVLQNNGEEIQIGYQDEGTTKIYNPKTTGNIGYEITYNMTKYVKTNLFAKKEIEVPVYKEDITYNGKKEQKKYKVKISSPSIFDMFSAKGKDSSTGGYWCIDSSKRENTKVVINPVGTTYYDYSNTDDYLQRGVKLKAYLEEDVVITGGKGTMENPYTISK